MIKPDMMRIELPSLSRLATD